MSVKQISVFLENKPGALCKMTQVLADNQVDMRALSLAETNDFGIVRLIVNNVYEATTVLKDAGFIHNVTSVLCVAIPDTPGGLHQVIEVLQEQKIFVFVFNSTWTSSPITVSKSLILLPPHSILLRR